MRKRVFAEILFVFLLAIAAYAAYFDATCSPGPTISQIINRLIYWQPVIAFIAGMGVMTITWLIHHIWEIRFRYVLAIITLGICLGHLFWSQDLPFTKNNVTELNKP